MYTHHGRAYEVPIRTNPLYVHSGLNSIDMGCIDDALKLYLVPCKTTLYQVVNK